MPESDKEVLMAGGKVSSSEIEDFHLIPTEGLRRTARRFRLGLDRKKDKAWNAITPNQEVLTDIPFILSRIDHVIGHALKLRDKVIAGKPMEGDDDAGAIAWAGQFLCCATKAMDDKAVLGAYGAPSLLPETLCLTCGSRALSPGSRCPACGNTGIKA